MTRSFFGLVVVVCGTWAALVFAQDPPKAAEPKSAAALKVKADYVAQMKLLDEDYLGKFKSIRKDYVAGLEVARKAALEKSDLDEAQRILELQSELEVDEPPARGFGLIAARYGAEGSWGDVAPQVRKAIRNGRLRVVAEKALADTAPGKQKALVVVYSVNGKVYLATVGQAQELVLPDPKVRYP